ncbi:hypothetical protein BGX30_001600 [Mortierella sp. GBA39]|nr:hypothetical protein BGX30_001600 [Mortierella sp. GBA39]
MVWIEKPVKGGDGTWTVTIEMGVLVSALDQYLRKHDPPLDLSSNVMPADIRYGGIISMGCVGDTSHDSTELFYWPTARFMKHERNEHFWLKQWRRTTDPVEDPDKYKDQLPTVDHPAFAAFKVGDIVKDLPDAIHFDVTKPGEGAGVRRVFDSSAAFKVNSNFKNVIEVMKELVDKNWAFSSSEFPRRLFAVMEVRFLRGSRKMMSFVYDEGDEEAVFCVINVMGSTLVPGFLGFSGEVLGAWMNKYNAKEYKDRLDVFNRIRKTQDPFDMFVNDTWKPLIEEREE